jgi:hypothetical protein
MDFSSANDIITKKENNSVNFAACRIINRRTHDSLCGDENKHWVTSYVLVYKAMSHVTLLRMRELSLATTLFG